MVNSEEWRSIPSLPTYEASSDGRIRRVPFSGSMPHGGKRKYGGLEWFGVWEPNTKRYILVVKGKTYKVARLICEAFHGPPSPEAPYCLHIDEDSRNNCPKNLTWGTQKENLAAPGYRKHLRTERLQRRRLTASQVVTIRADLASGKSQADTAKTYGVSACHISAIATGRAWA